MQDYSKFYRQLNDRQKAAVDAIDGPVLVLAGPGTGKTQLISVRAASILANTKTEPENILILTYTNPAARAMKERLAEIVGSAGYDIEVGTFHSFANSMLQDSAEAAAYVGRKVLMDDLETAKAIQYILDNTEQIEDIRPFGAPYLYLKEIIRRISDLKKDGITPGRLEDYLNDKRSYYRSMEERYGKRLAAFAKVYRRYEEVKAGIVSGIFDERGRYDFDDMILFATEALRKEEDLRRECRQRYRYVMVDEYQDTNGAQLELLFTLLDYKAPNLCCVGDDDQSIYRFQGANVANFRALEERFPGIKRLSLTDNYRSAEPLLSAAKTVIEIIPPGERAGEKPLVSARPGGRNNAVYESFTTEEEELLYIVDKVRELKKKIADDGSLSEEERERPYNNIAVLVRKREQILRVIDAFLRAGIPYATDGKEDISAERRVAQLMDVMSLARINPQDPGQNDMSLYRVLSADYLRIPQSDVLKVLNFINGKRRAPGASITILEGFLEHFSSGRMPVKLSAPDRMRHASGIIARLIKEANEAPVHTVLVDFIKAAGIYEYILKEYADNGILRIRQVRSLGSFVNMVKAADMADPGIRLSGLLSEMETRKNQGLSIQGNLVTMTQEGVRIYTAHGSKGLEFHSVIIPFCLQDKGWPARPLPEKLPLPFDIFGNRERIDDRRTLKRLSFQDETRLFYVAMTRAKANLIFTASPVEDDVPACYMEKLGLSGEIKARSVPSEEEMIAKSLSKTDSEDPFTGTDEVLRDMISSITLNPTRLNNYLTCRRKFLYNDVLKLPGAKKKGLVFGNCAHKALEEVYRSYKKSGKFPPFGFFEKNFTRELKYQGPDGVMERDCLRKMKTLKGWFDAAAKAPVTPIDLEKKLMVTVGDNIIFTGKYDKVEWYDEARGLVRILDYKTGKPDEHLKAIESCDDLSSADCDGYLRQLVAYRLLFEKDRKESAGKKVKCGVLVFIEPASANIGKAGIKKGEYVNRVVDISDSMVRQLEDIIIGVWNDIKALRFEKLSGRDDRRCSICDFEDICWS